MVVGASGIKYRFENEFSNNRYLFFKQKSCFFGFDLMYIGVLFTFFNWFLRFATSFVLVLFYLQIVNVEDNFFMEIFGDKYLKYKHEVCRYIGKKFEFSLEVFLGI